MHRRRRCVAPSPTDIALLPGTAYTDTFSHVHCRMRCAVRVSSLQVQRGHKHEGEEVDIEEGGDHAIAKLRSPAVRRYMLKHPEDMRALRFCMNGSKMTQVRSAMYSNITIACVPIACVHTVSGPHCLAHPFVPTVDAATRARPSNRKVLSTLKRHKHDAVVVDGLPSHR